MNQPLTSMPAKSCRSGRDQVLEQLALCPPGTILSLNEMAAKLHVSNRSLKRHLQKQGTTYRQVREEHLVATSEILLQQEAMSMGKIAKYLGYSNTSNFHRAFKRWRGTTPADHRKNLMKTSDSIDADEPQTALESCDDPASRLPSPTPLLFSANGTGWNSSHPSE